VKTQPKVEQKVEIQPENPDHVTGTGASPPEGIVKTADQGPEKPAETDQIEDLGGLPNRDLFRIGEVANYLRVSESTIRLWIQHGYFQIEKMRGTIWIPRASILSFRLKNRIIPENS